MIKTRLAAIFFLKNLKQKSSNLNIFCSQVVNWFVESVQQSFIWRKEASHMLYIFTLCDRETGRNKSNTNPNFKFWQNTSKYTGDLNTDCKLFGTWLVKFSNCGDFLDAILDFTIKKPDRMAKLWPIQNPVFRSPLYLFIYVTSFSSISYYSNVRLISKVEFEQDLQSIAWDVHASTKKCFYCPTKNI